MDKDIKDIDENIDETNEQLSNELPLIPLKDTVIFPHMVVPLFIGRDKSLKALEEAMLKYEKHIIVVSQRKPDEEADIDGLYQVGVIANVLQILKLPDGHARIVVQGTDRAKILTYKQSDPFFLVEFEKIKEEETKDPEIEAMVRILVSKFEEATKLGKNIPSDAVVAIYNITEPSRLSEYVATHLINNTEERQLILETTDLKEKLNRLLNYVQKEISILEVESRIKNQINQEMEKHQKEFYLREQIKAIQKELGEAEEKQIELDDLKNKIQEAKMPPDIEKKIYKEISRLEKMPSSSAEVPVIRTYLDWIVNLPWSKNSKDNLDIIKAEKILEKEHYGLKKVKERIIEFLAVRKLTKSLKGPILCFVGPPGVGKTSLGKSIAAALNRKFIRIALGGMRDEAEIRGHRKTYVGALPGRIIQSISQVQTNNPVFMMDEIDKVGADFRGDPTSALLEVLDPEQNHSFTDHYLEVPFDLSNVMFITTANLMDPIPAPLRDRMEVIEIPGYTEDEKVEIALRHLLPKQLKFHGLNKEKVKINKDVITKIIREYTHEAGVRNLERNIASLCRKAAKLFATDKIKSITFTVANLKKYLGVAQYSYGMADEIDRIGVVTGLAWTPSGGDILFIEASIYPGKGQLMLTGQLGDVMKESAHAALSYIKSNAKSLNISEEILSKNDMHIHVPEGAIPKDGPSAGVAIATSMVSALSGKKANKNVAMTGEITLRGQVLPIGGVREKLLAAHRAGIKTVLIPEKNKKDIIDIPKNVQKDLEIIYVKEVQEAFKAALLDG